jgi:aspartate aminotransferase-like enzyme
MGMNSCERNVVTALEALERALKREGFQLKLGDGVRAAEESYHIRYTESIKKD